MPITVDLDKNPFLRGIVEHVRKDCTVENIILVLHARFGRLPNELNGRLQMLSQDELDKIIAQSATLATLEEAVKVPLISRIETSSIGRAAGENRRDD
jgi:hypothetical protein